jgi:hypothetical protein
VFVADLASTGDFQELRVVPMIMNQLRLERYTPSSVLWKPNQGRYEFINKLSKIDAGSEDRALLLRHVVYQLR